MNPNLVAFTKILTEKNLFIFCTKQYRKAFRKMKCWQRAKSVKNPFLSTNKIIIIALKTQKIFFWFLFHVLNYRNHAVEVTARWELFSLLFTPEQCHKLQSGLGDNATTFLYASIAFYSNFSLSFLLFSPCHNLPFHSTFRFPFLCYFNYEWVAAFFFWCIFRIVSVVSCSFWSSIATAANTLVCWVTDLFSNLILFSSRDWIQQPTKGKC